MLNLFITFTIRGISIGGHIGGLVAGAAAGSLMAAPRHGRQPEWVTYVAPIAVGRGRQSSSSMVVDQPWS